MSTKKEKAPAAAAVLIPDPPKASTAKAPEPAAPAPAPAPAPAVITLPDAYAREALARLLAACPRDIVGVPGLTAQQLAEYIDAKAFARIVLGG